MTATVFAAVTHVSNQLLSCITTWIQKNSTTGITRANVAGDRPKRPGLVDHSTQYRGPHAPLAIPVRYVERRVSVSRRRCAVSDDRCLRSFGSFEPALLSKTRRLNSFGRVFEKDQSSVGNARLQWSDQDFVGWITLRRWRARRHRWVRNLPDHWNPCIRVLRIRRTKACEKPKGRRQFAKRFGRTGEVTGSHHDPIANQCATHEAAQLQRRSGGVDAPDHDCPDVGIDVLKINAHLSHTPADRSSTALAHVITNTLLR